MSALLQVVAHHPKSVKPDPRLVKTLGENAAADLQKALLVDMLWRLHGSFEGEIIGNASAGKSFYQSLLRPYHFGFRMQSQRSPGLALESTCASAFLRAKVPFVVTCACPEIDVDLIDAMTEALDQGADAVLVPATDGSYVALGLALKNYQLFRGIDPDSRKATDQILQAMFNTGVECAVFEPVLRVSSIKNLQMLSKFIDPLQDAELCSWIDQHL